MKVVKIAGWVIVALIAFIALSFYLTLNNLDTIVKQVVERAGSEALQTQVKLNRVDISLVEGRAELGGLTIKNLPGFGAENIFEMDTIAVGINVEALADKLVDITGVDIRGVKVVAEQKGGSTNIQQLLAQLPKSSQESAGTTGGAESGSSEFLIKLRELKFLDSSVVLKTDQWGDEALAIPDIKLANLGGEKGSTPDKLARSILDPLLKQVNRAVQQGLKKAIEEKAKAKLQEKEDELKSEARDKLREKLGDDAEKVEGALKNLLSR